MLSVLGNTFFIAVMKMVGGHDRSRRFRPAAERSRHRLFKRSVQTIIYFPHFLSWIILSGILIDILSPSTGIVNGLLGWLGFRPVYFLGTTRWFPYTLVAYRYLERIRLRNDRLSWRPYRHRSGAVRSRGHRWGREVRQTGDVTLPGLLPMIVLMSVLSLGNILECRLRADLQPVQPAGLQDRRYYRYAGLPDRA